MLTKEKTKFIAKVTIAHFITYMVCGMVFYKIFKYQNHIENIGFRKIDEISGRQLMFGQITRGILFGIVLWWIKDSFIGKKLGWLKLWVLLVIVGIIGVYAPAPASIEGAIYLDPGEERQPLIFELGSLGEVMLQPLLFSLIVTYQRKNKVVKQVRI